MKMLKNLYIERQQGDANMTYLSFCIFMAYVMKAQYKK